MSALRLRLTPSTTHALAFVVAMFSCGAVTTQLTDVMYETLHDRMPETAKCQIQTDNWENIPVRMTGIYFNQLKFGPTTLGLDN